jgi:uncharacterized protein
MRFFTTVKLGENRELTPAGFTLFRNVSIARIGEQIYGPGETEIPPGPDGLVYITRTPEEVFKPESMASGNGAPYVIDHPIDDVGPDNWQALAQGFFVDLRRGTGDQKDELVADLLVCTSYGLSQIDSGKREVSVGYDADYFQTGEGRGEQRNIVINHVAGVDAGRCGGRCAIKDHKHTTGASNVKKTLRQRIQDAFKAKDEEGLKKALDEAEEGSGSEQHIHIHTGSSAEGEKPEEKVADEDPTEKRFKGIEDGMKEIRDAIGKMGDKSRDSESEKKDGEDKTEDDEIEGELGEEAPDGTQDAARKARDSAYLVDSFESTKMLAEIIAPGIRIPTFDRAADPKKNFKDCICGLRRKALQLGSNDAATAGLVEQVRGRVTDSTEFAKMPCGQVRTLFNSVAALKKAANNSAIVRDQSATRVVDASLTPIQKFRAASDKRWGIGQK